MSRIHEALTRAEEQRTGRTQPEAITEMMVEGVEPELGQATKAASSAGQATEFAEILRRCSSPKWHPNMEQMLFLDPDRQYGPGMEEFRTLRARLNRLRSKQHLRTLLVASAVPGEGKTFVCSNVAQILARQFGRKVLVIDCDLRWCRLHQYFGTPSTPGMLEYLKGEANEYEIIQRSPIDGMFFVPGGTEVANPAELIGNGKLRDYVERMSTVFDWVILDSSPVIPVSDASTIAQFVDGILLVVESGRTHLDLATRARQEFKDRPIVGVVLNRIPAKAYKSYAYHYGAGYGEGYGYRPKTTKTGD